MEWVKAKQSFDMICRESAFAIARHCNYPLQEHYQFRSNELTKRCL
jgi:hypothetical protein